MTAVRPRATVALAAALLAGAPTMTGAAAPATPERYSGNYVATHVTGASVVRLELELAADGRARLRTGASRYTQRPTAKEGGATIETGTWRARNGRVVLHITHSSTETDRTDAAQYEDRTFVLSGCELHMVGAAAGFVFDKQHCS
ncbi:MAG: hypothetical protein NVS3B17_13150 [Vulcanimicrobiaceae bacterium]